MDLTVETFETELHVALRGYERHVVCLEKTTEECDRVLRSLLQKAIHAYCHRGPEMRHGIALDRQVTVILSQSDTDRPLCGIYFNLHSPYTRKPVAMAANSTQATR